MNEYALTSVAVSVAALGWLWLFAYASVRRDAYRRDIRAMRDGLFDFMWQHAYPFDNESYRGVREELNGLLRMSNTTSALQFVCLIASHIRWGDFKSVDHLSRLPDGPLKQELVRVRHLAIGRLLTFLFREGAIGVVVTAVLFVAGLVWRANSIKRTAKQYASKLLEDFRECGRPPLSAQSWSM